VGAQSLSGGISLVNLKNMNIFYTKFKGFAKFEWGPRPPLSSTWVRPLTTVVNPQPACLQTSQGNDRRPFNLIIASDIL
jgi:hypothetical protein